MVGGPLSGKEDPRRILKSLMVMIMENLIFLKSPLILRVLMIQNTMPAMQMVSLKIWIRIQMEA